jgi:Domain of unknown function (DUF4388)
MQLSGLLSTFPPAELLQWAHNDQLTGTLVLRRSSREKQVLFRKGKIVGCLSNERFDFYGQHLLARGYVTEPELLVALSECEERGGLRLGQVLIRLGLLDEPTVIATLVEQTEQAVMDLFIWPRGVFFLLEDEPPQRELEFPGIDPIGLVLEGVHQIDEINRIRQRLPHDGVVLRKGPRWPGNELSPLGRRIVGVFRADMALRDLHEAAGGAYCPFLTETDELLRTDVFAVERLGEPTPDTVSLSLLDLMLDRVQEERQAAVGATVSMPLAVLGQLYPLWLEHGSPAAASEVAAIRELARGLDGRRKLGHLLSGDPAAREEQLEWLWLRIGSRELVLLPSPAGPSIRAHLAAGASEPGKT